MISTDSSPELFLVDVFADRPCTGNPLAVVVGADPDQWPSERMQAFAREMNFSETTFAAATVRDGAYDVRIFTPSEELPFAGHPTLGTAWVLGHHVGAPQERARGVLLRLGVGVVRVEFEKTVEGELVRMRPPAPRVGGEEDAAAMAAHLGLPADAIDARFPCRRVNIGVEFVVVPLTGLAALAACAPISLPSAVPGQMVGVLALSPQPHDASGALAVRVFFDAFGLREDPATGSAAACLAAYLSAERYLGDAAVNVCVQQGYEMGRPSRLYLEAIPQGDGAAVSVAGKVVAIARGHLV